MLSKRIIACLDVRDGQVVKGINFEGLRSAGDPADLAPRYNAEGVDELPILDITATPEGRAPLRGARSSSPRRPSSGDARWPTPSAGAGASCSSRWRWAAASGPRRMPRLPS